MSGEEVEKDWLQEVLNGTPADEIPPEQLFGVYEGLIKQKDAAIAAGNVTLVKQIQGKMTEVMDCIKAEKEKEFLQGKGGDTHRPEPELLDSTLDSLIAGKKLKPSQAKLVPYLIPVCASKKQECIKNEDFRHAQNYEDVYQYLYEMHLKCKKDNTRVDKWEHQQDLYRRSVDALTKEEQKRDQELVEFNQKYLEEVKQFEENYQQQVDAFNKSIPEELPARFVKRSQQYLNLRQIEKSLLSSKRYTEAAEIKEQADKMDIEESKVNRQNFDIYNQQQRDKLAIEHEKQRSCLEEKAERQRQKILLTHTALIENLKLAVENNERKLVDMDTNFKSQPLSVPKIRQKENPDSIEQKDGPFITQTGKTFSTVSTQTVKRYKFPSDN